MDWHAELREAKRRKRGKHPTHGKSVFLIQEQIRKRAQGQQTDPARPGHNGHHVVVNGSGNRWCDTCSVWVKFCPHGRAREAYCARCSL